MFIGEAAQRGKGYGASALRQLIAHAFQTMGLRRLYLHVLADNAAAIGLYEHCGFKAEGRLKRHAFKLGRYQDVLVMGLCAPAAAPRAVRRRRRA
jgi:RimJ/RimL family protein N-acetyltransferase